MAKFEFTAGALIWSQIRDLVSRLQFEGHDISMWESSGWLSRDFVVKGEASAVKAVERTLRDMERRVNEARRDRHLLVG